MHAVAKVADLDVAAASGLVCDPSGRLAVIADDELELLFCTLEGATLERVPLFPGQPPLPPADAGPARKRAKPDLEALALLPDGRLLALGSGSGGLATRRRGVLVGGGAPPSPVDLAPLYLFLERALPVLNLEGAATSGDRLRLLSRANVTARTGAVIDLDLGGVLGSLRAGSPWDEALVRDIVPVDLGELDGVPLGFTDATPDPDRGGGLLFSAAAEDTSDPVADGKCSGSVVGRLDARGHIRGWTRLQGAWKVEGITTAPADQGGGLLLCADADDRGSRAPLLRAALPPA